MGQRQGLRSVTTPQAACGLLFPKYCYLCDKVEHSVVTSLNHSLWVPSTRQPSPSLGLVTCRARSLRGQEAVLAECLPHGSSSGGLTPWL